MLKVGSDFSGVGAFNQALTRLGVEYQDPWFCGRHDVGGSNKPTPRAATPGRLC